jgi:hypothetical protein
MTEALVSRLSGIHELRVISRTSSMRLKNSDLSIPEYLGLGENEQAFAWLEEAYKERSNMLQFVKVHPLFDPLRGDPRFADLVHRVGLG